MKEDEEPNSTEEIQELFFRLVKQEDFQQIRKLFGDEAVVVARKAATTKNNVEEEEEEESSDFEQTPISRKKQQIAKFAPKRKNPSMIPNAVASPSFSHSAVVSKTTPVVVVHDDDEKDQVKDKRRTFSDIVLY